MEAKPSGGIGHVTCKWNTIGENGSLVGHGGSDRVGRLRASSPVCDEIGLRYMSYSGSCVKGKGKGLHGFWVWNSSVTVQAMKMGRGLGQDVEDSGSCRKCQRGPEPSFSFQIFFFFSLKIPHLSDDWIKNPEHPFPYPPIWSYRGRDRYAV